MHHDIDDNERSRAAARARSLLRPAAAAPASPSPVAVLEAPAPSEPAAAGEPAAIAAEPAAPAAVAAEPAEPAAPAGAAPVPAPVLDAATPTAAAEVAAGGPRDEDAVAGGRPRRLRVAIVALSVAVVALAAALGVTASRLAAASANAGARTAALAAARSDALDLTTYSYQHLSADFSKVLANATPSFERTYTTSSAALEKVLGQYKASATGTVVAEGVVSSTSNRVVVLLFVNQRATNSTSAKATTDESRIQMTLVRMHGRWLIDQVKLL